MEEPLVRNERVIDLPAGMNEFNSEWAAVVVDSKEMDVMCVEECTNEWGVCVRLDSKSGSMYVCSMYCKFNRKIEPYLEYLERVIDCAKGRPLIVGMNANAVSPMWHSKNAEDKDEREERGNKLEQMISAKELIVLNEPSEYYTFSGPNGESDIDVTLGNAALLKYECNWELKIEWCESDHNAMLIEIRPDEQEKINKKVTKNRWKLKGADWEKYGKEVHVELEKIGYGNFL